MWRTIRTWNKDRPCPTHVVIRAGDDTRDNKWRVMVEDRNGCSQWPIQYEDGTIAYDFPERLPRYAKQAVEAAFNFLK